MDKTIQVVCDSGTRLPIDDLNDFQGELKELSEEAFGALSKEIISTGFAFAPHVWRNPDDEKWYILDGHQRLKTVRRLIGQSGFSIPYVPVVPVQAASFKEAKRRVLQAASQYGEVTQQGLFEFMKGADLAFDDVKLSFEFPQIDMDSFGAFFKGPPDPTPPPAGAGSQELGQEQFSHLQHTCPKCGFQFGKGGVSE